MNIEMICTIISTFGALFSIIAAIVTISHNKYLAINEFFTKMEEKDFVEARKHVYNTNYSGAKDELKDEKAAEVVNFFHHWGYMVRTRRMPLSVFAGSTGVGTCKLYRQLEKYISSEYRNAQDGIYGEDFVWLNNQIQKKYRYVFARLNEPSADS